MKLVCIPDTKVVTWTCSIVIANNCVLKHKTACFFTFVLKQGNTIDGVVLNWVCISGFFVLKRVRVFLILVEYPPY